MDELIRLTRTKQFDFGSGQQVRLISEIQNKLISLVEVCALPSAPFSFPLPLKVEGRHVSTPVCLPVSRIPQRVMEGLGLNLVDKLGACQGRID